MPVRSFGMGSGGLKLHSCWPRSGCHQTQVGFFLQIPGPTLLATGPQAECNQGITAGLEQASSPPKLLQTGMEGSIPVGQVVYMGFSFEGRAWRFGCLVRN